MPYLIENFTRASDEDDNILSDTEDEDYVPPQPTEEEKVGEQNELHSSLFGDSEDDGDIPPPPPMDNENSEDEDDDDVDSLASENYDNPIRPGLQEDEIINEYYGDDDDDDDEDDEDESDNYLQKFDQLNKKNIIQEYHPELVAHNNDEVETLSRVVRNEQGVIIDPLHKTLPFITKYEKARILGERAKQINMGAKPLIEIGPEVMDGYLIALKEFQEKRIPFVIKRPMPNGGCEYWKFKDLEVI